MDTFVQLVSQVTTLTAYVAPFIVGTCEAPHPSPLAWSLPTLQAFQLPPRCLALLSSDASQWARVSPKAGYYGDNIFKQPRKPWYLAFDDNSLSHQIILTTLSAAMTIITTPSDQNAL